MILVVLTQAASSRAASFVPDSSAAAEVKRRASQDLLALRVQVLTLLQGAVEEGPGSNREALIWSIAFLGGLEVCFGIISRFELRTKLSFGDSRR